MSLSLWLTGLALVVFVAAFFSVRAMEIARSWRGARCFRMHFPRNVSTDAVTTFLTGLTGLRPSWFNRFTAQPAVIFEVHAEHGHIEHFLHVPHQLVGVVLSQLRAALPSVRLDPPEPCAVPAVTTGIELGISTETRPLRTANAAALSAALLTSMQPLRDNERVVTQWIVSPAPLASPPRLPTKQEPSRKTVASYGDGFELVPHAEALKSERGKQAEALLFATGRIGVEAASATRRRHLSERMMASFQLLSAAGVQLKSRWVIPPTWAARRLRRRAIPIIEWPTMLNAAELAGVIGWPIELDAMPALTLGGCRQLPPDAEIPSSGCVIGRATYPGAERPVAISPEDRKLNAMVIGPTGSGKSNLLARMMVEDAEDDRGFCLIDFKGDLCDEVLDALPAKRAHDVIVIDPADTQRPVGWNLLDVKEASVDLVIDGVVHVFREMYGTYFGPRTADCMLAGLHTLMRRPGQTLLELPLILSSRTWRAPLVAAVQDDPVSLGSFWSLFESLRPNEQANVVGPLANKLRQLTLRKSVKFCIGQAEPRFSFREAFDSKKLIVIRLSQGALGDEASILLGNLFFARIWQTIQGRAVQPASERVPSHLYVDEAHRVVHGVSDTADMLAQCRGLNFGVTLASQTLTAFPKDVRDAISTNCRSKVVFQPSAADAPLLAKEFAPFLTAEDLQGLGRYEVVAQLAVRQRVAPPLTAVTLPPPEVTGQRGAALAYSRSHYGQSRDALEEAMAERQRIVPTTKTPSGRTGRTRRPS